MRRASKGSDRELQETHRASQVSSGVVLGAQEFS